MSRNKREFGENWKTIRSWNAIRSGTGIALTHSGI